MNSETKICQNCKEEFIIESEDSNFYKKINVPPPTWCPECRMIRRFMIRNERSLYGGNCDNCGKRVISMYHSGKEFPVYCNECWWGDSWEGTVYGREYDFSKPFFEQFRELYKKVPHAALIATQNLDSPYAGFTYKSKNVYLSASVIGSENILYSWAADQSFSCTDCYEVANSELCYWGQNIERCYRTAFLIHANECMDSQYLFDCSNCKNCFLSSNLRSKQYVFQNVQYSKDEYMEKVKPYQYGRWEKQREALEKFKEIILGSVHRYARVLRSVNATGDNIYNAKNVHSSFDVYDVEDVKYAFRSFSEKDSMDVFGAGPNSNHSYECVSTGIQGSMEKFSAYIWENISNVEYSVFCHSVSRAFACIGLRNKQYCILNKQYSKEEYEELVPRIVEHMNSMPYVDKQGRTYKYGEFFPPNLSPFAYNETIAQEYYPLTKEQTKQQGYRWKDPEERKYEVTMTTGQIPDYIKDVKDDILNQIIECSHRQQCNEQCTKAFKIIQDELAFYRNLNLPLPRLCPNCRHYQRLKQRNPLKLWHRTCNCSGATSENKAYNNSTEHFHGNNFCPIEFETSYAPERPEIVYCEQCYQQEVV